MAAVWRRLTVGEAEPALVAADVLAVRWWCVSWLKMVVVCQSVGSSYRLKISEEALKS